LGKKITTAEEIQKLGSFFHNADIQEITQNGSPTEQFLRGHDGYRAVYHGAQACSALAFMEVVKLSGQNGK